MMQEPPPAHLKRTLQREQPPGRGSSTLRAFSSAVMAPALLFELLQLVAKPTQASMSDGC